MKTILALIGVGAIVAGIGAKAIALIIANIKTTAGSPVPDYANFNNGFIALDVPVAIENKNPFPIGIQNFFGVVHYGDLTLSNISLPLGIYVPAYSSQTVVLNLDIPVQEVVQDIGLLVQQGNIWNALINRLELDGSVRVGAKGYSFVIYLEKIAIPLA
jgi:LEA14-like dessication related protein